MCKLFAWFFHYLVFRSPHKLEYFNQFSTFLSFYILTQTPNRLSCRGVFRGYFIFIGISNNGFLTLNPFDVGIG